MAFSEHLLGLSLIATPVIWRDRQRAARLQRRVLSVVPALRDRRAPLAYQLTRRHDLALVAGLAYGFAPYRMAQFSHVQVLSELLDAVRAARAAPVRAAAGMAVARALRGAWYLQALACGYYLFYLSVLVGLWLLWFAVGRIRWADFGRI